MSFIMTLLLFTYDQTFDTIIPCTAFGICAAMSGVAPGLPPIRPGDILWRIFSVTLWLWLLALQFCVQNQRDIKSIQEDRINKPWRPLPAERISLQQTDILVLAVYLMAAVISSNFSVLPMFGIYSLLVILYNDFSGGDCGGMTRNLFFVGAYSCLIFGALRICIGADHEMSNESIKWATTFVLVLGSTIQASEFRDESGDKVRGRKTIITTLGRRWTRISVIISVAFWSIYVPLYSMAVSWLSASLPISIGGFLVILNLLMLDHTEKKRDRFMYQIWGLWMLSFCPLPLLESNGL
ncbi:hypothetical protein BS50DRAFT_669295 [Corynespora cassiicola Philippines]|uniref:UbiA prenyltransferase n=1 Tax=Corynespora cassiicola Philippines TaxID=1448308 RepID=A0A2T2NLY1_CORCC|nr:hypothetical protein BS50DRAFT_669295 [Corynespora cassiicola Philippines]